MENKKGKIYQINIDRRKDSSVSCVEILDRYTLPDKIYGSIIPKAVKVWNAFCPLNGKSGVLAVGKAGSGKSMFCHYLCNIAIDNGLDVYYVRATKYEDGSKLKLINYISTLNNCVIFMDEFEKMFNGLDQNLLLPVLADRTLKRLFLITANYSNEISNFIYNRPDRIRYCFDFDKLEPEVIIEYCEDRNVPKSFVEKLLELSGMNASFCFDHLRAIVEEHKFQQTEDLEAIIQDINVPSLRERIEFMPEEILEIETNETMELSREHVDSKGVVVCRLYQFKQPNSLEEMTGNEITSSEDNKKENEKIQAFLERFKKNYDSIDIHTVPSIRDNEYRAEARRNGEVTRKGYWVKIILTDDFKIENKCEGTTKVFKDVTNKYEVTFKVKTIK